MTDQLTEEVEVLAEKLKGKAIISVDEDIWKKGEEELRWAIVLKLSQTQEGRVAGLTTVLRKAWNVSKEVKFMELSSVLIVVRFDRKHQSDRVWEGGPWSFMGDLVMMQKWDSGCDPTLMKFDKLQIWIQVHRVPLQLMKDVVINGVAAVAGKVCHQTKNDTEKQKYRFSRVKVEIDIDKPLVTGCFLDRGNKKRRWLAFKYERLPIFAMIVEEWVMINGVVRW